jgi:hypothetical protein
MIYKIYKHSTLIMLVHFLWSSLSVSWQRIYNTRTMKVSLNYTFPISMYYCIHKVFKSHVKFSQADFLYSSVFQKLTACLLAVLLQLSAILLPLTTHSYSLGIMLLYRCFTGTDLQKTYQMIAIQSVHWRSGLTYRKHMSHDF